MVNEKGREGRERKTRKQTEEGIFLSDFDEVMVAVSLGSPCLR